MNMRKAVAAAFGAALLGAGTGAVVGGPAHGLLSTNSTGNAKNNNSATGGDSSATCTDCSASIDAPTTATGVAGVHQGSGRVHQKVRNQAHSGNANGSNHGSAKSGSQSFRIR